MTTETRPEEVNEIDLPTPLPITPIPLPLLSVSGLYTWSALHPIPLPQPLSPGVEDGAAQPDATEDSEAGLIPILPIFGWAELRLDVDGLYPQMQASGTSGGLHIASPSHWIAKLTKIANNTWTGPIWYKDPPGSSQYTNVKIVAHPSFIPSGKTATVTFYIGAAQSLVRTFTFKSPFYHPVELEYDSQAGVAPSTSFDTATHPNKPATLPNEVITIDKVYKRAGFDATLSPGASIVPIAGAGPGAQWSNQEMHDAMQVYWSRFANKPQWALWTFFASQHEMGTSLGGIMFDDIGPNQRQGTAMFSNSFISNPPAGDPHGAAFVNRMRFWTACHEIGHTFNLAHSWQKALGTPWIPLANEPLAMSFMNYPYNYPPGGAAGTTAFFSQFSYRFSSNELVFMRHAPFRFVEQGNALWFDHHGFQQFEASEGQPLQLELRVNRDSTVFEFMEPVVLEMKLKNVTTQPRLVAKDLLQQQDQMVIVVKKEGQPARQYRPFARYCMEPVQEVLAAGESVYESLFVSVGTGGWHISEPGNYVVQMMLEVDGMHVVSNQLNLRVLPPLDRSEEVLAQDFFSDGVGRVLSFDGSTTLSGATDTLQEVAERMQGRKVAMHSAVAVGMPSTKDVKVLSIAGAGRNGTAKQEAKIEVQAANMSTAATNLDAALLASPDESAAALGHIDYRYYVDKYADALAESDSAVHAAKVQSVLYDTLAKRKVLPRVLAEIKAKEASYTKK